MGVLKSKRSTSNLDWMYEGLKIQDSLTDLCLRDFGIKPKKRSVEALAKAAEMDPADAVMYVDLNHKYGILSLEEEFPYWFVDKIRNRLLNCLELFIRHLTIIRNYQSIMNTQQYLDRQKFITLALSDLDEMLQTLQYAIKFFPIDVNKLMPYTGQILQEKENIKRLRKRGNKEAAKLGILPRKCLSEEETAEFKEI